MTESFETLTLSEVRQLDSQRDADLKLRLENLDLGEFEGDEFEEVDEFEDDWEESVGVDGEWDIETASLGEPDDFEDELSDGGH
jgi:hypothetical protein